MSLPKGVPAANPTLGGWPELDELLLYAARELKADPHQLAQAINIETATIHAGRPPGPAGDDPH